MDLGIKGFRTSLLFRRILVRSKNMKLNVEQKINFGFIFALLTLLIVGILSYLSIESLIERTKWVAHTQKVIAQLKDVQEDIQNIESGSRGYVITGEGIFLEQYESGTRLINKELGTLRKLLSDKPIQLKALYKLELKIKEKINFALETINIRKKEGFAAAVKRIKSRKGLNTMKDISTIIAEIEGLENQLLSSRTVKVEKDAQNTISIIILGSFLALIFIIVANTIIQFDIKSRKEVEARLRKLTIDLTHSNSELEQFAYVASHDLQEPLRVIRKYTEFLAESCAGSLHADTNEIIKQIVDSADRMQQLIKSLLELARVGKQAEVTVVDCNKILSQVLLDLDVIIQENKATITYDNLPIIYANRSDINRLLQNLIANAIKYRSHTSPHINVKAELESGEWLFSVSDNGIGIDMNHKDRIFEIFRRLHSRNSYPGIGIGLPICKKIVERRGGRIWVESKPGEGSTFYFIIPNMVVT